MPWFYTIFFLSTFMQILQCEMPEKTHDNDGKVCKSHEKRKTLDPTPGNEVQVPHHGWYTRTTINQLLQDDRECFKANSIPCLFISVFPGMHRPTVPNVA